MTDSASRPSRAARFLFTLLDAPIVGAVGVGLLAAVLHPRLFWWAQLIAIGLPYATWALVGATLLAAVLRWRPALWVHGVLLVLVVLRLGLADRLASPEPADGDLRLVTFNLPQTGPSQEALKDSAAAFVEAVAPDVLLLQDTWVDPERPTFANAVHVAAIVERQPYRLAAPALDRRFEGRSYNEMGVPMLVRARGDVEVLEQENLIPEGGPDVSIALRSRLRWDGREFVLYNVHLRSFGPVKPWDDPEFRLGRPSTWVPFLRLYRTVYAQRAEETEQIADRVAEETLPVVIAGDFNSTADNWSARRLRHAGARRLDAFHVGAGTAWGRTYHAARPFVRIDYVFVDPALEVTASRVYDVGFSDHRPVEARLRWAASE